MTIRAIKTQQDIDAAKAAGAKFEFKHPDGNGWWLTEMPKDCLSVSYEYRAIYPDPPAFFPHSLDEQIQLLRDEAAGKEMEYWASGKWEKKAPSIWLFDDTRYRVKPGKPELPVAGWINHHLILFKRDDFDRFVAEYKAYGRDE